jgi:hypothetical protein
MEPQGGSRCIAELFFNLTQGGGGWSTPRPGRFTPAKHTIPNCLGCWVDPRTGLDGCGKSPPPQRGFDLRTVQLAASHHTNFSIPANHNCAWISQKVHTEFSQNVEGEATVEALA